MPDRHPVRDALRSLPDLHTVLHGLHTKQGMVDHVVVAPSGVFAITGWEWPGRVRVRPKGDLAWFGVPVAAPTRDALEQATRLRRQLAASGIDQVVTAVLSLASAKLRHGTHEARGLVVLETSQLAQWIARRQRKIDNVLMYRIADELSPLARS